MRVLSGIQPSGSLHLGNYLGMMKPVVEYMDRSTLFVFIFNFHALTAVTDGEKLAKGTLDAAADFRKDEDLSINLRIYVPDIEKMKTWSPTKAEMLE